MRRIAVLLVGTLALSGAAKDPLDGRVAGAPARCISDSASNSGPTIGDEHTIFFNQTGRRIWVVHPVGACPSLRPLSTLVVEKWGGNTCANDRFRVITPGLSIPSAYCRFGEFVPYDKPKR